ncbi:colicin E3-like toxin immunity protein [Pseudomonas sp. PB3P13]
MGLKLRLEWYDKTTEIGEGREFTDDLREDVSVLEALGIPTENTINNGGFDVQTSWVTILQPYFRHLIDIDSYDYQISFDYRNTW